MPEYQAVLTVKLHITFEAKDKQDARKMLRNPLMMDHDVQDSSDRKYVRGSLAEIPGA